MAHTAQLDLNFLAAQPTDICRRKHGDNPQSVAANEKAVPGKALQRERIRVYVAACGWQGATSGEIEQIFGWAKNRFSGRLTELRGTGDVFVSGRVRSGCTVWVSRKEWSKA